MRIWVKVLLAWSLRLCYMGYPIQIEKSNTVIIAIFPSGPRKLDLREHSIQEKILIVKTRIYLSRP